MALVIAVMENPILWLALRRVISASQADASAVAIRSELMSATAGSFVVMTFPLLDHRDTIYRVC